MDVAKSPRVLHWGTVNFERVSFRCGVIHIHISRENTRTH